VTSSIFFPGDILEMPGGHGTGAGLYFYAILMLMAPFCHLHFSPLSGGTGQIADDAVLLALAGRQSGFNFLQAHPEVVQLRLQGIALISQVEFSSRLAGHLIR